MNEKLSPTIGQPKVPGMVSIAFGEAHECSKRKHESRNTDANAKIINMLSSIANL